MDRNKKKLFKKLLHDYNRLLKEFEEALSLKFLLWLNKYKAFIKDAKQEETDIFSYIEKELIPKIQKQRKTVEKLLNKLK